MKKQKGLWILIGIFILLGMVLLLIIKQSDDEPVNTASQNLLTFKVEDLASITINQGDSSLTLIPANDEENRWTVENMDTAVLNLDVIKNKTQDLASIDYMRTIENPDLKAFGLDPAEKTLTYKLKNGNQTTLSIGMKTVDGSSYYAYKDHDTSKAYLISTYEAENATCDLSTYRLSTLDVMDRPHTTQLVIGVGTDEPYTIQKLEETDTDSHSVYKLYRSDLPDGLNLSNDAVSDLIESMPSFYANGFVSDDASNLAHYGLDQPSLSIKATTLNPDTKEELTYDYIWGNTEDDGQIYFMKRGDQYIYSMDDAVVKAFIAKVDLYSLSDKNIAMFPIREVEKLSLQLQGTTYDFNITHQDDTETFSINGTPIADDTFRDFYGQLISLKADTHFGELEVAPTAAVTLTYYLTNGKVHTYTYYPYNDQFYVYEVAPHYYVGCNIRQFNALGQFLVEKILSQ